MESPDSPEPMSIWARLFNVFASPGELYSWIAGRPFAVANWLVPCAVVALIGALVNVVVFSNPVLLEEIRGIQIREIQRRVDDGKMRQQDADQAKEAMNGIGMAVARVAAPVAALLTGFLSPFWWGLFTWLVGRAVFRAPMGYMRGVEIAALASLIGAVGMVVGLFLAMGTGRLLAGPHLGALIKELDLGNRLHLALVAFNFFSLWQTAVMAIGVSRFANRPFLPVAVVLFGLWLGYKGVAILLGLAQFAL
ncbi:MAG: YIP1 family protein [Verrucomicrobiales bacterium]|nr:YIP1 family protein [Verrucomicrobiales bacterium]